MCDDHDAGVLCRGDRAGWPSGNERCVFALAFLAVLNPKLFAVDLLLMENARPRLMLRVGFSAPPEAGWVRRQG